MPVTCSLPELFMGKKVSSKVQGAAIFMRKSGFTGRIFGGTFLSRRKR
jgi:hypothetical protein